MLFSGKKVEDEDDFRKLEDVQWQVNYVRLPEKLGKQKQHYFSRKFFDPVTRANKHTKLKKSLRKQSSAKTIGELKESKVYLKTIEEMI